MSVASSRVLELLDRPLKHALVQLLSPPQDIAQLQAPEQRPSAEHAPHCVAQLLEKQLSQLPDTAETSIPHDATL